jgi:hypothetical protein
MRRVMYLTAQVRTFLRNEKALAVLFVILVLRVALVIITSQFAEGAALVDSRAYMAFANTIVQGATYTDLNSPPGYPLFIAMASGWSDPSFVRTVFAQLVLSSAAALLLVSIGTMIVNKQIGLIAGWLYALSPNTALWALTIMSETLYAFFLVLCTWMWLRAKESTQYWGYVGLGVLLGSSAMIRNIGLIIIPAWIIVILLYYTSEKHFKRALLSAVSIALGSSILLIAWAAHNARVHGEFTLTEEHSRTFYVFNIAIVLAEVEGISRDQAAVEMGQAEDPLGRTIDLFWDHPVQFVRVQINGIMRTMFGVSTGAWARVFGYPLELQGSFQLLSKILAGEFSEAYSQIGDLLTDSRSAYLLGISIFGIGHTALLYVLCTGLLFRGNLDRWTIVLILVTVGLLILSPGSVGQARFRIPAEPLIVIAATAGYSNCRMRASGKISV